MPRAIAPIVAPAPSLKTTVEETAGGAARPTWNEIEFKDPIRRRGRHIVRLLRLRYWDFVAHAVSTPRFRPSGGGQYIGERPPIKRITGRDEG
jgi:hypothetical protein